MARRHAGESVSFIDRALECVTTNAHGKPTPVTWFCKRFALRYDPPPLGAAQLKVIAAMWRPTISVIAWFLCIPALLGELLVGLSFLRYPGRGAGDVLVGPSEAVPIYLALLSGYFAWFCLFRMNIYWVRNEPLHWCWPVLGTTAAIIGFMPFQSGWTGAALFASPGILFACFLVIWHLAYRKSQVAQ